MKKTTWIVEAILVVVVLVGTFTYFQKSNSIISHNEQEKILGDDPVYLTVQTDGFYEGKPKVGEEILVTVIIEVGDDRFDSWDWNTFKYYSRNCDETGCKNLDDVFQIEYENRRVTKNDKEVTITVPVKILKEGMGNINFEYVLSSEHSPSSLFTPAVYVKTV